MEHKYGAIIHGQDHTRFVLMSLKYSLPFSFVNLEVQLSEGKFVVREAINLPGSPVRNGPRENNIGRTKSYYGSKSQL